MAEQSFTESLLKYLRGQAPIFYLSLDTTGKIVESNEYTLNITGKDIYGKIPADIFLNFPSTMIPSNLIKPTEKPFLLNIDTFTGLPQTFYFQFFEHNNNILAIGTIDANELETLRKELLSVNNELSDLTRELQKKNAELEKWQSVLEQKVKERTSEIEKLKNQLEAENIYLQEEVKTVYHYDEIVGNSKEIRKVLSKVEQVAETDATVLILGETGTGKELLARAIHNLSPRKNRTLVKVNCAALPDNLIESELFGHEKGSFTGATAQQIGRFEIAHNSTIFLDEIGELSLNLQSKLLRVLQDGEFERIGKPHTIKVDARVIAATNRDLEIATQQGTFREDLYYRLNVFPLLVPPLRDRKDDILPLVWAFVRELEHKMGKKINRIATKTIDALHSYPWPGNVRELRNIVERAMIVSKTTTLSIDLPKSASAQSSQILTLEENEKQHILKTLRKTRWRVSGKYGAAKILNINPKTLESRMKKLGIRRYPTDNSDFS